MTTYNNFKEFKKEYPSVGSGDWQDNEICFHENTEEFCNYELTEGWHSTRFDALSNGWDTSCNWTNNEVVVSTTYGW